jgi:MFS family permease
MGEAKLIFSSLLIYAVSLFALPFATTIPELLIVLALLAIGSGLNRPPVFGMISLKSSAAEQGANLGVAQSFGSLARILGPMFAVPLFYVNFNTNWLEFKIPYLICGGIALVTGLFAWKSLCHEPADAPVASTPVMEK